MSWRLIAVMVCDSCGTLINADDCIILDPGDQLVLQRNPQVPAERDFCCEACEKRWKAEYPKAGVWGPSWEDRNWWCQQPENQSHVRVRRAR